jgi:hypothetical protein
MPQLSPLESEFDTTEEAEAYDAWFRAKVHAAMNSRAEKLSHDEAMARVRRLIEDHRAAPHLDE